MSVSPRRYSCSWHLVASRWKCLWNVPNEWKMRHHWQFPYNHLSVSMISLVGWFLASINALMIFQQSYLGGMCSRKFRPPISKKGSHRFPYWQLVLNVLVALKSTVYCLAHFVFRQIRTGWSSASLILLFRLKERNTKLTKTKKVPYSFLRWQCVGHDPTDILRYGLLWVNCASFFTKTVLERPIIALLARTCA